MFINLLLCIIVLLGSCQDTTDKSIKLVVDTKCETTGLPERFRKDEALHASGSGQFYEDALEHVVTNVTPHKLLVIDLRQESHGFINGAPVTWLGKHNWANKDKLLEEVEQDETIRLSGEHGAQSEKALCKSLHVEYMRIPVQDNCKPTDFEVNRFIARMKSLPKNTWVHFHCYAGIGRTTLFLAMYDMMQHAKRDSFDDIIVRQVSLGGVDLRKDMKASRKVARCIEERKVFIERFYDYCRTNNDNFNTPFTS